MAQQRQIGDLAGSDLERRHAEPVQQIDAVMVEWRRQEQNAAPLGMGFQRLEAARWEFQRAHHVQLTFALTRGRALIGGLGRVGGNDMLGPEGLELDGVGTGARRRVDQPGRDRRVAVVVDAGLGDDEAASGANAARGDVKRFSHGHHRPWRTTFATGRGRRPPERASVPDRRPAANGSPPGAADRGSRRARPHPPLV